MYVHCGSTAQQQSAFTLEAGPTRENYCFVLTSLVLGGLHQRSGVALPTGGRADPAVSNEALAGTRRSVFFSLVPGARWYPTLKPRLVEHTQTHTDGFFFGDVSIRNSLRSNKISIRVCLRKFVSSNLLLQKLSRGQYLRYLKKKRQKCTSSKVGFDQKLR